jgi:hypothetical protein
MKLAAILLAACASMTFRTLQSGAYSPASYDKPTLVVARDPITLRNVWNIYIGVRNAPEIDFKKQSVVVLLAGEKRSGGFGINVKNVSCKGSDVTIDASIEGPPRGSAVTMAITHPFTVVSVSKAKIGNVRWMDGKLLIAEAKRPE